MGAMSTLNEISCLVSNGHSVRTQFLSANMRFVLLPTSGHIFSLFCVYRHHVWHSQWTCCCPLLNLWCILVNLKISWIKIIKKSLYSAVQMINTWHLAHWWGSSLLGLRRLDLLLSPPSTWTETNFLAISGNSKHFSGGFKKKLKIAS